MAPVVSEDKTCILRTMLFLIPTFSTHAGSLDLSQNVWGLRVYFECDGDESNLPECVVGLGWEQCSRVGIITQCYSCKDIVGLNTCGVRIECISCST